MTIEKVSSLVIGGGPAGLMAAGSLIDAGHKVVVAESKPSPARKFLMAGKSGLNLTMDEPFDQFLSRYGEASDWLAPMITEFGPEQVQAWARSLDQEVFTGSSGRVFPVSMKASPLLRRWLVSLKGRGLDLRQGWRWAGLRNDSFVFETPSGRRELFAERTVLALGGASWSRLGSDGAWVPWLSEKGAEVAPFQPANMGFSVCWSSKMLAHAGSPLKSIALVTQGQQTRGEAMITARGLEGGAIYAVSRTLREGAPLTIDLFPDLSSDQIQARLSRRPKSESLSNRLRKALRLEGVRLALFFEFAQPLPNDDSALAVLLKALPARLDGPFPLDEAISVAGGVTRAAVDEKLMLRSWPGVFVAGEMLNWEAPTGGYLLTACLATGLWAGQSAASWAPGQCDERNH